MDNNLQCVRSVLSGKFGNVKEMMEDTIKREKGKWYTTVNSFMYEFTVVYHFPFSLFIVSSIISFTFPNLPLRTLLTHCKLLSIILVFMSDEPTSPLREA